MPSPDQKRAIVTRQVSKTFGGVKAVKGVDLSIAVGERRALIGPNGAGKSTLFNLITGDVPVDGGEIHVLGRDVTRFSVERRARLGLGRTYQISQLFLNLSVEQNLFLSSAAATGIGLNLLSRWRDRSEDRAWTRDVAEQVGLTEHLFRPVAELAHGLQRQLELGMALAMRPRLIMLDEPAAGLSPAERQTLVRLIRAMAPDITLILIEHDMDIVMELAQRITVLHRGSVVTEGTPDEIRRDPMVQRIYLGEMHV
ncbi:MAG: ABC transporter ATP-binding protein [Ancalomicrobiaceae bacterium]|nr:ABC transporter ATP-binding protein [Ancalomicrobiaceae bacterium]